MLKQKFSKDKSHFSKRENTTPDWGFGISVTRGVHVVERVAVVVTRPGVKVGVFVAGVGGVCKDRDKSEQELSLMSSRRKMSLLMRMLFLAKSLLKLRKKLPLQRFQAGLSGRSWKKVKNRASASASNDGQGRG